MTPLVLTHGRRCDSGLDRGCAQQPVAVSDPHESLRIREGQDQTAKGATKLVVQVLRGERSCRLGNRRVGHDVTSASSRPAAKGPSVRFTGMMAARGTTHISNQFSSS